KVGDSRKQLNPICSDALDNVTMVGRHKMQALLSSELLSMLARFLEIAAELNQLRALPAHRCILFAAVAVRHNDSDRHVESLSGQRNRLPMIAARRGDEPFDPIWFLEKFSRVDNRSPSLERADRGVVFVLHPHL